MHIITNKVDIHKSKVPSFKVSLSLIFTRIQYTKVKHANAEQLLFLYFVESRIAYYFTRFYRIEYIFTRELNSKCAQFIYLENKSVYCIRMDIGVFNLYVSSY